MKMRYSSRVFLYAPLFFLLALAVAAALRWQAVAGGLENWLRQHNGHEIAPGVTLYFASESVGGFPFNVDEVLTNVTFQVKSARTSGSWHTDAFAIHELTFGRDQQIYEAAGGQTVSWTDAKGGAHHLAFVPGSLRASTILSRGQLARFDLDINGIGSRQISGARLQLHFRKAPDRDATEFAMTAEQLRLAPALQAGFGADLWRAEIEGSLVPSAPFAALFAGHEAWDRALDAWRRSEGAFHLDSLAVAWDGVHIHASGRLGLDDEHRLQGTLELNLEGAVKAPAPGTPNARFARALVSLTNISKDAPRSFSADIVSGTVNLRVNKARQFLAGVGSVGPLY